ncbi:MAG: HDIG domain-containing protein [Desulfuromonadales bacterium]|nr:HDIG domain-containing protein [Desulfuromonadales bacterium]
MSKERKKESSASRPLFLSRCRQETPDAERQRLQRFLLLVLLVVLLAFVIVPKGTITPIDFTAGDIAPRDIKAPATLLIPDDDLTAKKRDEAVRTVPLLYDYDPAVHRSLAARLNPLLDYLAQQGADPRPIETLLTELETNLGFKFSARRLQSLLELAKRPDLPSQLEQILHRVYRQRVTGNLKLFEADRPQGIVFRHLDNQVEQADSDQIRVIGLGELQVLVRAELAAGGWNRTQRESLEEVLLSLLRPNISFNQNETELRRQRAREAVQPVLTQVKKGEMIVREGDRISQAQIRKLDALKRDDDSADFWRKAFGLLSSLFLLVFMVHRYAGRNIRKYRPDNRDLLFMACTFVGQIVLLKIAILIAAALGTTLPYLEQNVYYYAFPFAVGPMLVRIVLNSEFALVFALVTAVAAGLLFGSSFTVLAFALLSSLAAAHWVKHLSERSSLYRAGIRVGMFNFLTIFALHLLTSNPFDLQLVYKLLFGLAGGPLIAVLVIGIIPLIESLFRYTTNLKLLELANMNNPLLRELMVQAPGTYHHSIIVGNLAEAAAETIGVNPLTVRVAAYYHDVGKIKKPLYFIENVGGQENRHDKLAPSMSALILMAHVKDGIEMAREHRLGQQQIDIIRQHHGTSLMKFFYDRAKSKADPGMPQVDERDYRYPGPKPQTREAALIMLADAIEAASRTLTDPTPARVQGMVQKIINNIFIDGQLDECELTLKDLHNIAKSFNRVLAGIYHHRVDYPEPVSKERHVERPGKKDAENSDRKPPRESQAPETAAAKSSTDDLKRLGMS